MPVENAPPCACSVAGLCPFRRAVGVGVVEYLVVVVLSGEIVAVEEVVGVDFFVENLSGQFPRLVCELSIARADPAFPEGHVVEGVLEHVASPH